MYENAINGSIEDCKKYLDTYPEGRYVDEITKRLEALRELERQKQEKETENIIDVITGNLVKSFTQNTPVKVIDDHNNKKIWIPFYLKDFNRSYDSIDIYYQYYNEYESDDEYENGMFTGSYDKQRENGKKKNRKEVRVVNKKQRKKLTVSKHYDLTRWNMNDENNRTLDRLEIYPAINLDSFEMRYVRVGQRDITFVYSGAYFNYINDRIRIADITFGIEVGFENIYKNNAFNSNITYTLFIKHNNEDKKLFKLNCFFNGAKILKVGKIQKLTTESFYWNWQ